MSARLKPFGSPPYTRRWDAEERMWPRAIAGERPRPGGCSTSLDRVGAGAHVGDEDEQGSHDDVADDALHLASGRVPGCG